MIDSTRSVFLHIQFCCLLTCQATQSCTVSSATAPYQKHALLHSFTHNSWPPNDLQIACLHDFSQAFETCELLELPSLDRSLGSQRPGALTGDHWSGRSSKQRNGSDAGALEQVWLWFGVDML